MQLIKWQSNANGNNNDYETKWKLKHMLMNTIKMLNWLAMLTKWIRLLDEMNEKEVDFGLFGFAAFAYFLFVFFSFVYTGGRICVRERRMLSFNV